MKNDYILYILNAAEEFLMLPANSLFFRKKNLYVYKYVYVTTQLALFLSLSVLNEIFFFLQSFSLIILKIYINGKPATNNNIEKKINELLG